MELVFDPDAFKIPDGLDFDGKIQALNEWLKIHEDNWNWGFYTGTKHGIYRLYYEEGKFDEAFNILLEICYLDLNGPQNMEPMKHAPELLGDFPIWNLRYATIAPAWIEWGKLLIKKLNLSIDEVRILFSQQANNYYTDISVPIFKGSIYHSGKLPISPSMAWDMVKDKLLHRETNK